MFTVAIKGADIVVSDEILRKREDLQLDLMMRYEDLVWKASDQTHVRDLGRIPSRHHPLYPTEESFIEAYSQLCNTLRIQDPVRALTVSAELEPELANQHPHLLRPDASELFEHVITASREGSKKPNPTRLNRNQAIVLGVMLGFEPTEFAQFFMQAKGLCPADQWDNAATLSTVSTPVLNYQRAHDAWLHIMAKINPQFQRILDRKNENALTHSTENDEPEVAFAASVAHDEVKAQVPEASADENMQTPKKIRSRQTNTQGDTADTPHRRRGRPPKAKPAQEEKALERDVAAEPQVDTSDLRPDELAIPYPAIRFSRQDIAFNALSFPENLAVCVGECIGEENNYHNMMAFLHALDRFSTSLDVDAQVQHLVKPHEQGLTRTEAQIMMIALGLNRRDQSQFLSEAQQHFEEINSSFAIRSGWNVIARPITEDDEIMLLNARPMIIADANRHAGVQVKFKSTPKAPAETPAAAAANAPSMPLPELQPPLVHVTSVPPPAESIAEPQEVEVVAAPPLGATPPPPAATEVITPRVASSTVEADAAPAEDKPATTEPRTPKKSKPKKTPPASDEPPSSGPHEFNDTMRNAQRVAVEKAREAIAAMETYNADTMSAIATTLLLELVENSPLSAESWRAKALSNATDGKINEQAFQGLIKGKTITHESFAVRGATKTLVPKLVGDESLREEVANYVNGIPLQHIEKPGEDILQYLGAHHGTSQDFCRMVRHYYEKNPDDFAAQLDIDKSAFTRLSMARCSRVAGEQDIVEQAADALQIDTQLSRAQFHTLVGSSPARSKLGVPAEGVQLPVTQQKAAITQHDINTCFASGARFHVNSAASDGQERSVALSRFVALVMNVKGLNNVKELGEQIAQEGGLDVQIGGQIAQQLRQSSMSSLALNPQSEANITTKAGKGLSPEYARLMAQYAVPVKDADDSQALELRTNIYNFLNRENYQKQVGPRKGWKEEARRAGGDGHSGAGGNL